MVRRGARSHVPKADIARLVEMKEAAHADRRGRPLSFQPNVRCLLLAHDCARRGAPFRTRLDNNGQGSARRLKSYAANDPAPTSAVLAPDPFQCSFGALRCPVLSLGGGNEAARE